MASQTKSEPIEVWLVEPGEIRAAFTFDAQPLEYLPADAPLPNVGDLILLPRNVTGDSEEQAFAYGGRLSPFEVVEREHMYYRKRHERLDPTNLKPARYVKTVISVQRLTEKQFSEDRGWRSE